MHTLTRKEIVNLTLAYLCINAFLIHSEGCIRLWTSSPAPKPWEATAKTYSWWQEMHKHFVENSKHNAEEIKVLFYGDSIIQGWSEEGISTFTKYYIPVESVNYGISGDRTEHLLYRIQNDEVTNLHPKVIVLMIGTNNMGNSADLSIARGVYTIVHELRMKLPLSKILLVGILPKSNRSIIMERVNHINKLLALLADGLMIRFLDMTTYFCLQTGSIRKELYQPDLLHLSSKGYEKWAEVMDPLFTKILHE